MPCQPDTSTDEDELLETECIDTVRGHRSTWRDEIIACGKRMQEIAEECVPPTRPHFEAAVLAQAIDRIPYVSVALEAHRLCEQAIRHDLDENGYCAAELVDLAAALAHSIDWCGITREQGEWKISRALRQTIGDFARRPGARPSCLAFDADEHLEVIPR
jgi:hypothetical protein